MSHKRPNVLVVITDHQRADSLGMVQCGKEVMPRLNQFAANATVFRRAYTTAPLCLPARTAMATGVYPTAGLPINDFSGCAARQQTLATRELEKAGYHIAYIGKNDIRTLPPTRQQHQNATWIDKREYEEWRTEQDLPAHPGWENRDQEFFDHFYKEVEEVLPDGPVTSRYSQPATGKWEGELEDFRDLYFYREMRDWLEGQAEQEAPFAAFCSIPSPHPPLEVPQPYADMYDPETLQLPPNTGLPAEGEPTNRARAVARQLAEDANESDHRKAWSAHLGLLTLADDIFGKILDDLERLGLDENTLVIFTSDHGHHLGQHNMFGINELYEQTVNVPLICRLPGGSAAKFDQPVSHLSIVPTLFDAAGIKNENGFSRRSLLDTIKKGTPPPEEEQYFQFSGQIGYGYYRRGVVTRRYKYIHDPEDIPELYDLQEDPLEMNNLAENSEYREILEDLHEKCRRWHQAQNDWVDLDLRQ